MHFGRGPHARGDDCSEMRDEDPLTLPEKERNSIDEKTKSDKFELTDARNLLTNHSACPPFVVYIAAAFPYGFEFSMSIASCQELTR